MSDPSKVSLARCKAPCTFSGPLESPLPRWCAFFTSCTNHSHIDAHSISGTFSPTHRAFHFHIAGLFISTSCFACTFHFLVHSISWSNPVQQLEKNSSTFGPCVFLSMLHISTVLPASDGVYSMLHISQLAASNIGSRAFLPLDGADFPLAASNIEWLPARCV